MGWPWPKHWCFDEQQRPKPIEAIADESFLKSAPGEGVLLAVVTKIEVHPQRRDTILHLQLLDGSELQMKVAGEADIAGEMVVVDHANSWVRFWKGHESYQVVL
ncbi:hypothetical protein [Rhizobium sp. BR 249]|uniref:hypothetical protein n=1 Tax=Rhizobium sp. BR 249 TaxID=3040011 RepID=UPI0039BF6E05